MATTTRKVAPKKSKALQSKTGAGAAVAERSKDAKKPFGKAAPKTVKSASRIEAGQSHEGEGRGRQQAFHGHARDAQGQEDRDRRCRDGGFRHRQGQQAGQGQEQIVLSQIRSRVYRGC